MMHFLAEETQAGADDASSDLRILEEPLGEQNTSRMASLIAALCYAEARALAKLDPAGSNCNCFVRSAARVRQLRASRLEGELDP
mmetsp:Transcript_99142/g.154978  ORF Transcript_99142/g.154978 Transcript_99142/m.154978 type:complete len:85 (+) Transcript_99142:73-327(+)